MRRWLSFESSGVELAATLDGIGGETGLLIVSGGNEIRSGAHGGMVALAWRIAEAGHPVFRFDRAGVGDSGGENGGYRASGEDIAAAAGAFRALLPDLRRIVAFGNCDAATALALFAARHRCDALVLANPWLIEDDGEGDALPPAAAIRSRYREKIADPREWLRLLRGGVDLGKLFKGLRSISARRTEASTARDFRLALESAAVPTEIILADRDATARVFAEAWSSSAFAALRKAIPVHRRDSSSHSFAAPGDADMLFDVLVRALARESGHF